MDRRDPLFKKIPHKKVSDRVFEQIQGLIADGTLRPDEKLPSERELVQQFDVSRASIREAIIKLELAGFVEQRHGEGTFIRSFTEKPLADVFERFIGQQQFIHELMEIRTVLETWAAAAAAERATDDEIEGLRACVAEMRQAHAEQTLRYELNLRFHRGISEATRNTFLTHIMNTLSGWLKQVTDALDAHLYDDGRIYDALLDQHVGICRAIEARDPEAARRRMLAHLTYTADEIRKARLSDGAGGDS